MASGEQWHQIEVAGLGSAWVGWGIAKNQELMVLREISFEAVLLALTEGGLRDITAHENTIKYPNQHVLYVDIRGYMHRVPCLITRSDEDGESCFFLKTVYKSRKAQRSRKG